MYNAKILIFKIIILFNLPFITQIQALGASVVRHRNKHKPTQKEILYLYDINKYGRK